MNNADYIANLLALSRAGNGPVEMGRSQVSTEAMPRTPGLPPIAPTYYGGAPAIGGSIFSNDARAYASPTMPPPVDLSQYNLEPTAPYLPPAGTTLLPNIGAPPPQPAVTSLPAIQAGTIAGGPATPPPLTTTPGTVIPPAGAPDFNRPMPQLPAEMPQITGVNALDIPETELDRLERKLKENRGDYTQPVWRNKDTGKTTSNRKEADSWGASKEVVVAEGKNRNKKWSWWEKLGAGALGWLTGGLAGGIKAATDRNYFEKIGEQRRTQELLPQIAQQQQVEADKAARAYRTEQIANMQRDDARREKEFQTSQQRMALTTLQNQKSFDPDDPADAELARRAGLDPKTLKKWDDRNVKERVVNGIVYRRNNNTGAYEQAGLPADESKTLTDYTVEMPDGTVRTYKVAQSQAASLATQLKALGARESQFQQRLEFDKEKFAQAKSQFERVAALREKIEASNNADEKRDYVQKLAQMIGWADVQLKGKKMDQGQYDILMETIGSLAGLTQ